MLLLPWILLVGCTADKLPADDSAPSEAFPCTNFSGDATFERVHGEIDGYVLVPWYDPAGEEAGVLVLDSDGCSRMSIEVPPFVTVAKWRRPARGRRPGRGRAARRGGGWTCGAPGRSPC